MLSIIIPTLNARAPLPATLNAVIEPAVDGLEIVVVDGGSLDGTPDLAREAGAGVVETAPGRGRQLAAGAKAAQHDWMLFLHADTHLPQGWARACERFMTAERNMERAGYFDLGFDDPAPGAARVARLANWRARLWGLPYGDQGLLIHRTLYDDIGGYDETLNLMEDVDLVRKLGPMRVKPIGGEGANPAVTTSAEKYRAGGWWARPAKNLTCLGLYLAGAPMKWVERLYR